MKAKQIATLVFLAGGSAVLGFFGYETINLILKDINLFSSSESDEDSKTSNGPTWIPRKLLKQEIANNSEYNDKNKTGRKYQSYLLAVQGDENDFNREIWEEKYKNFNPTSSEFSNPKIVLAFSKKDLNNENNNQALNKVCETIYKKQISEIKWDSRKLFGNKPKLRNDFWKYCSVFGETPKLILEVPKDNLDFSGKIGGKRKTVLLAVSDNENVEVWNIKQKKLKSEKETKSLYFKKLKEDNLLDQENALRNKCKEAYKLEESGTTTTVEQETESQPSIKSVLRYCSIES